MIVCDIVRDRLYEKLHDLHSYSGLLNVRLRPWSFCKMRLDRVSMKLVACELLLFFRKPSCGRHDRLRHDLMSFPIPTGMRSNSVKGSTKWREPGQVRQLEVAAAMPSFSEF